MKRMLLTLIASGSFLAGCGSKDSPAPVAPAAAPGSSAPSAATANPQAVAEADKFYQQTCTPCHGPGGHGDGAASASLDPKPRNFGDAAWQASVTDDYIIKIIKFGGAAVGKSPAMPANPSLRDEAVLAALKDKIRSFKGQ